MQFILWCQSWIITPVFRVTWAVRNNSNVLICCSRNMIWSHPDFGLSLLSLYELNNSSRKRMETGNLVQNTSVFNTKFLHACIALGNQPRKKKYPVEDFLLPGHICSLPYKVDDVMYNPYWSSNTPTPLTMYKSWCLDKKLRRSWWTRRCVPYHFPGRARGLSWDTDWDTSLFVLISKFVSVPWV